MANAPDANVPTFRGIYAVSRDVPIAAGGVALFPGRTRFLAIVSATDVTKLSISFDGSAFFAFPQGFTLSGFDAANVWIRNDDTVANNVTIATGLASLVDNRFAAPAAGVAPVDLEQVGGVAVSLGQKTMAASFPVVIASNQSALPVSGAITTQTRGALTDGSGSIAAPATAQNIFAANATRAYLFVQNISADTLWINFGTNAVEDQPSVRLSPGASFAMEGMMVSTQLVSIIGPNAAAKFVAKEG